MDTPTPLRLLLIGGPGSGKGTQSRQLSERLGVPHISTGAVFRQEISANTPVGRQAAAYINHGQLVPDALADTVAREILDRPENSQGYVLDGYPRSLPQACELDRILSEQGRHLDGAIYLDVPDDEIVERLSGRLTCRQCQKTYHRIFYPPRQPGICDDCGGPLFQRDDDNETTVRARLKTFYAITAPVLDYYRQRGLLINIAAGQSTMEDVTARVTASVQALRASTAQSHG